MSVVKILNDAIRGYPWSPITDYEKLSSELSNFTVRINSALSDSTKSKWNVAFLLASVIQRGLYRSYYTQYSKSSKEWIKNNSSSNISQNPYKPSCGIESATNPSVFYTYCRDNFGLSRTYTFSILKVFDEFTEPSINFEADSLGNNFAVTDFASKYSFWQLIEMLPLSIDERLAIQPNWTREKIRDYKKSLKMNNAIQPAESEILPKEKPVDPKYSFYSKYSKKDLIDEIYDLKEKLECAEATIKELSFKSIS